MGLTKDCKIDRVLPTGTRVTVRLTAPLSAKVLTGVAVSPDAPREEAGLYWGYQTRLAAGLSHVWSESPFSGGYDLCVGTSDKGADMSHPSFALPPFKHLLIVFGGVYGLEEGIDGDDLIDARDPSELFDLYINACQAQGSRTIRTEEAIPITLSALRSHILRNPTVPPPPPH